MDWVITTASDIVALSVLRYLEILSLAGNEFGYLPLQESALRFLALLWFATASYFVSTVSCRKHLPTNIQYRKTWQSQEVC